MKQLNLLFLCFFTFYACREESDKIDEIKEIKELYLMEYKTRYVMDIAFPKLIGENRFLVELIAYVRFCVNLEDLKYKIEGKKVIFSELPKAKVCNYDVQLANYDEDVLFYSLSAQKNRREVEKIAQDSLRAYLSLMETDSQIQSELRDRLKEFLSAFVSNFKKEAVFEK
ncbi:MAG: DUF4230 domain-containing protein [candidate division WOR-3 bacterium]|nr:DUF4230 domain-containing protein [candidate division WOR-3 bacterium]MCX7947344.1 DUF4230 domain-containing protein [candidate division WOR-3 bacterium]MDW8150100.1 DUF4230 domain-containing protein [candidate division WOR-3 bacterium]